MPEPALAELVLADEPQTWEALGFVVAGGAIGLGGVTLRLAGRDAGEGIVAWGVHGLEPGDIDGLRTLEAVAALDAGESGHPNGAIGLDHVVALTGDLDRSIAALRARGLEPRRIRDVPGQELSQAFYVLETALLELSGPVADREAAGFWGLVVVVSDLDALIDRLGDLVGEPRDAVQPGRRIATLRPAAGSSTAVAFMTPR
jgi:hypothetical protein